jgi:hypothetical protein
MPLRTTEMMVAFKTPELESPQPPGARRLMTEQEDG